jgi:hypothetical protein
MTPRPWTVEHNEPIRKLSDRIWMVRGPVPGMGMPLPRTMVMARRADGSVVIHSAIALDDDAMRELEARGAPSVLICPNGWHRIDAHSWKQRYPAMKVYCPRSQMRAVAEVVPVDGALEDFPADDVVKAEVFDGLDKESVLVVRDGDRTSLAFGDTFINQAHMPGVGAFFFRLIGATGGPKVHPMMKLMSKSKRLRAHLLRLAEMPGLARLIPGHGDVVEENAAGVLRAAAERV